MKYSIHTLIKNAEPDVLLESSLINYGKLKTAERYFDRIPRFLVQLYIYLNDTHRMYSYIVLFHSVLCRMNWHLQRHWSAIC